MPAVQIQTEDQKAESVSLMIKSLLGAAAEIRQTQSVKDVEMLWGQFEKSKSQNVLGKIQTFVQAKNFSAALEILDKAVKVGLIGAELTAQLKKSLELGHVTRALFNINEIKIAITSFGSFDPYSDNLFFRPGVIDFAKLGADFETIKQLVLATIDNYTKVAGPSKEEELKCFTCDFFKV